MLIGLNSLKSHRSSLSAAHMIVLLLPLRAFFSSIVSTEFRKGTTTWDWHDIWCVAPNPTIPFFFWDQINQQGLQSRCL